MIIVVLIPISQKILKSVGVTTLNISEPSLICSKLKLLPKASFLDMNNISQGLAENFIFINCIIGKCGYYRDKKIGFSNTN